MLPPSHPSRRRAAAATARRYLDSDFTYDDLIREFYDSGDSDIDALFDTFLHQPSRRGFFAASEAVYLSFRQEVLEIVRRLETT